MKFFHKKQEKRELSPDNEWMSPVLDLLNIRLSSGTYQGIWALKNSDIFAAVRSIAGDIASCPVEVKKNGIPDPNDNIAYLLNKRPNQYYSGFVLKFIAVANMLLNNESVIQIVRDPKTSEPLALYFVKNSQASVLWEGAELKYQVYNEYTQQSYTLPSTDVLHFKMMSLDGISGISPLYSLIVELQTQDGSKNFVKNFFDKGAALGGILKMNSARLNPTELREKGEEFSRAYTGAINAGKIAAIDSTMDFNQLEINTEILNFLNANTFTTKQVAKAFGLPLSRMGIETVNTSTDQENIWYLSNTLSPYLSAMSGEMDFKMAKNGVDIVFNTDNIRDADPDKKLDRIIKQVQNSIASPNEGRKAIGKPPIKDPSADQLLASLNYTTLKTLSELQLAKANGKGGDANGQAGEGNKNNSDGN
ncbi:phage portal protein [Heyndrickxia coagulans]|uniref:phage portal protein n=2 Tax=Bacillales TaxID=1385 RepID=UPI002E07C12D|nr:phage portal protein [Heyndrickxia coagulans]MEC5268265.1 phage portal protein [Heyndrickxia coagulans]